MVVFGLALLYGAYKCFSAQAMVMDDPIAQSTGRRRSVTFLPLAIGIILALLGGFLTLAGVTTIAFIEKYFKPAPPQTHDNSNLPDNIHGPW